MKRWYVLNTKPKKEFHVEKIFMEAGFRIYNPKYKHEELLQLMDQRSIFEYWSHAAAYLPMEDYRLSLFKKEEYKNGGIHWFDRNATVEQYASQGYKQYLF